MWIERACSLKRDIFSRHAAESVLSSVIMSVEKSTPPCCAG